ncbi:Spliceosome-associated protein 49 [Rhizina undulata]
MPPGNRHWLQDKECTVYVGNLDERVSDTLLWELMTQAGKVVNVHVPKDRVSQTHQGFAFVEFSCEEDAEYCSHILNYTRLFGKPIRVNKASADHKKTIEIGADVFIGNLDPMVDEKALAMTFSRFGNMLTSPKANAVTSASKGYAFVSYDSFEASDKSIEEMNGQWFWNRGITVQYAYKKDGKGERHGDAAERKLAEQAKKNNVSMLHVGAPLVPGAPTGPKGQHAISQSSQQQIEMQQHMLQQGANNNYPHQIQAVNNLQYQQVPMMVSPPPPPPMGFNQALVPQQLHNMPPSPLGFVPQLMPWNAPQTPTPAFNGHNNGFMGIYPQHIQQQMDQFGMAPYGYFALPQPVYPMPIQFQAQAETQAPDEVQAQIQDQGQVQGQQKEMNMERNSIHSGTMSPKNNPQVPGNAPKGPRNWNNRKRGQGKRGHGKMPANPSKQT